MSLIYNGTTIQKIVYNNVDLDQVYYGSTLVWQKPIVYDGSKFGGIFKNGIVSGPSVKAATGNYGTEPIDQAASGATYTTGPVSISHVVTQKRASGSSSIYAGFRTVDPINLTNISKINLNETIVWYERDASTSSPDWIYLKFDAIYFLTKNGNSYVISKSVDGRGGPSTDGINGRNVTTGTAVVDCSSITGSYYLYFNFIGWYEWVNHQTVSCTVNNITIT